MAKRRPSYLILVSSQRGIEVFSAHHTEAEAVAMHDRLGGMLSRTAGSTVHLLRVPDTDGLVAADHAVCRRITPKDTVVPPPSPPQPAVPPTQEEYEEETRRLAANGKGPRDGYRDDKYVGAYS